MPRPRWVPPDWRAKILWTAVFVGLASLALALAWLLPLKDQIPATVERVDEVPPEAAPANYTGEDVRQYPFLKQAIERAEDAGGRADTLVPGRAWVGWVRSVESSQPGADPSLVRYGDAVWRVDLKTRP